MSPERPQPDATVQGGVEPASAAAAGARLTTAAKVGLFSVVALSLLGGGIFWLGNFKFFGQSYDFRIWFPEVAGLGSGARVQLMGVRIGQVKKLGAEGDRVIVAVEIEDVSTRIQRDAIITIGQNGLLGEKVIDIQPNKKVPLPHPGEFIPPEALVQGFPAPSLTAIVADVQYAVKRLRGFVDDPDNRRRFRLAINRIEHATAALDDAMGNVVGITAKTNRIVGRVEQVAEAAPAGINALLSNVRLLTASMDATLGDVRKVVGDPTNQRHLAETTRNLASLTERLNLVLKDVQGLTSDVAIRDDLKVVLHNARETMTNAAAITKTLNQSPSSLFSFNASGELLGAGGNDPLAPYVQANVMGQVNLGGNYLRIGLEDIGGRNMLAAQYGLRAFPFADLRFGLLRGKLGAGTTVHITDNTDVMLDVFDLRTPVVRATLHQQLFGNWGLAGFYQNTLPTGLNEYGFGLRWRFLSKE